MSKEDPKFTKSTRWLDPNEISIPSDLLRSRRYQDVSDVVEGIQRVGQILQPVGVDRLGNCWFGARRVLAARQLGLDRVPVVLVEPSSPLTDDPAQQQLLVRITENGARRPLSPRDAYEASLFLEKLVRQQAERRQKRGRRSVDSTEGPTGDTRDILARAVGMGWQRLERICSIYSTADQAEREGWYDLPRYRQFADRLDEDVESVNAVWLDFDEYHEFRSRRAEPIPESVPTDDHVGLARAFSRSRRRKQARRKADRDNAVAERIRLWEQEQQRCQDSLNVYEGDCREVFEQLEPESVRLLFTDPPYESEDLPWSYPAAARAAERLLVPGGWLVVYAATFAKPTIYQALETSDQLLFQWEVQVNHEGDVHKFVPTNPRYLGIRAQHKSLVLYAKGTAYHRPTNLNDVIHSQKEKESGHPYQQSTVEARYMIDQLTRPNDLVVDIFAGSGTTLVAACELHRRWIGIEIEHKWVVTARQRLAEKLQNMEQVKEAS